MGNVAVRQTRMGLPRNGFIGLFLLLALFFQPFAHAQPGNPCQISGDMVLYGDVMWDFQISAGSNGVVYQADKNMDEVAELYSVPMGGGEVVKLKRALPNTNPNGSDINSFSISPDSTIVVYNGDQDLYDEDELFGVKIKKR